jgi:4-diphosphocytidyl-2-C-methyl-D-erythritol kinase
MPLTLTANAKINIGLRVIGRREDGYHQLHTLFQEIDFGDKLTLSDQSSGNITLKVSGPAAAGVPDDSSNLCHQAANLLKQRSEPDLGSIHIQLEKHIPVGAGLGGGSSDAAAVLRGLNELWGTGFSPEELEELATELGADVPFFIRGGLQLGEGIGEQLTPLELKLPHTIVLVIPPFGVDTAWAYSQLATRQIFSQVAHLDHLIHLDPVPWKAFTNDFEEVVFQQYGKLANIKEELAESGAIYTSLSGSGSAVYGFFYHQPPEDNIFGRLGPYQIVICHISSRS